MDVTRLEKDIALGIASCVRAQQLAGPTLDRCIPGMVGEFERQRLQAASRDLLLAYSFARTAQESFLEASKTLAKFTKGDGLAGTDNSTSPDSKEPQEGAESKDGDQ